MKSLGMYLLHTEKYNGKYFKSRKNYHEKRDELIIEKELSKQKPSVNTNLAKRWI